MGLYALSEMGANQEELHQFAKNYIDKRDIESIKPSQNIINDENFNSFLGKENSYSEFVAYYLEKIKTNPNLVFKEYLNELSEGFAGGAFHGLIRAAYAYELNDPEELAKSLAYLSEAYLKFDIDFDSLQVKDPIQTILDFSTSEHFKKKEFKRPLITGRMIDVYEDDHFHPSKLRVTNIEGLYSTLLKLYALTKDFTVLHGFTSTHALAVLKPLLENYDEILQRHWFNLQTAYLSTNCTPILDEPMIDDTLTWEDIFNKSKQAEDVHVIKLNYSLYKMSQEFGQSDFAKSVTDVN